MIREPATHPVTGHECRVPKPERWHKPKENFKIEVVKGGPCWKRGEDKSISCDRGTPGCDYTHEGDNQWYAEITGDAREDCDVAEILCEVNPVWSGICEKGTKSCPIKHARTCEKGVQGCRTHHEFSNLTFGDTPAQAVWMAFDLIKLIWDECSPEKEWNGEHHPHCYCRDTTYTPSIRVQDEPEVVRFVQCCRCEQAHRADDFED